MNGPLLALTLAVAGGVGSGLRFLLDSAVRRRVSTRFPWGLAVVNLTGSWALGVVTGASLGHPLSVILATGLLGGYTTFSAASLDTAQLLLDRRWRAALANGVGVLGGATLAAVAGVSCGALLR